MKKTLTTLAFLTSVTFGAGSAYAAVQYEATLPLGYLGAESYTAALTAYVNNPTGMATVTSMAGLPALSAGATGTAAAAKITMAGTTDKNTYLITVNASPVVKLNGTPATEGSIWVGDASNPDKQATDTQVSNNPVFFTAGHNDEVAVKMVLTGAKAGTYTADVPFTVSYK
ncbi:TPA: hypothetical protein RY256_003619 [Salmonella enterica]|nr:hypothetical protein [Salmonella enterica]HEB0797409.1 hypothetical protein [Salmonella enterica]HEB0807917.1 hypothetical protein [Salmonella enterica]HEB0811735.1 hypothetical protein [Salmonella enterica]HEB0816341.1 hypothetical protein [Salmonella enterica]